MANPTQVAKLKEGLASWNHWHAANPGIRIDLRGADLEDLSIEGDSQIGAILIGADLREVNLRRARMRGADLTGANLSGADLRRANLVNARLVSAEGTGADFRQASMRDVDLRDANLARADLSGADLFQGRLRNANLVFARLSGTVLFNADLAGTKLGATTLENLDFSTTHGLSSITHLLPSDIGYATLWKSRGMVPEDFLFGAGMPEILIRRLPSFMPSTNAPPFSFHFISHADADEEFTIRLQARLRTEGVPAWVVPESLKRGPTGDNSMDGVRDLSKLYDKLIVVISEASVESEWLSREIHYVRKREFYELRRILLPIRIAPDEVIGRLDDTMGNTLRSEYLVHDFSGWRYELSEPAVRLLLNDLRKNTAREDIEGQMRSI